MNEIPGPQGLLGLRNVASYARDPLGFLERVQREYGDFGKARVLGTPWYLVTDPVDIETILVKHQGRVKRDMGVEPLKRPLGLGLLTSEGELWKRRRRLLSSAFSPKRVQTYGASMLRVAGAGIDSWRAGEAIRLDKEMSRITMEVVADVFFGADLSREHIDTVSGALKAINEYLTNSPEMLLRIPGWVPTPLNVRTRRSISRIDQVLYTLIEKRRASVDTNRDDILATLLAARDDDGAGLDDTALRDEAMTLFLAGHETTALALTYTFLLIAEHPEIERRLRDELRRVVGDGPIRVDHVPRLKLFERVLKESMRLYPPVWITGRETTDEIEVRGHRLPKGTQIAIPMWIVHRDRRWFDNPLAFDPDRWARERKRPRFAYFPFGGGARICIGNHFAMMEGILIMATILRRCRLELTESPQLTLQPSVTLRPGGRGLTMRVAGDPIGHRALKEAIA